MKRISIRHLFENNGEMFYILAETAFSHEGDFTYLKNLIREAKLGGANGIKFQLLLNKEESYSASLPHFDQLDQFLFSREEWQMLIQYSKEMDLDVIVLPIDEEAVQFCLMNRALIDGIEVHSINFNQRNILEQLSIFDKYIFLGVGGRTLADLDYVRKYLQEAWDSKRIMLIHGFQSFPTNYKEIKLARIAMLQQLYHSPMGYADHTSYDDEFGFNLIEYAYLNGARLFEKHLVLEKGVKRIDYEAGGSKEDLIKIRQRLELLTQIQDQNRALVLTENELNYRAREKQLVTVTSIQKGEIFTKENLGYKVHQFESDFEQKDIEQLVGRKASQNLLEDMPLKYFHVE